jgi:hypothetical protein
MCGFLRKGSAAQVNKFIDLGNAQVSKADRNKNNNTEGWNKYQAPHIGFNTVTFIHGGMPWSFLWIFLPSVLWVDKPDKTMF